MNIRKRPIEFPGTNELIKGTFHQWGISTTNSIYQHQQTVAIVEDENGQIHEVIPSKIKFTDK